MISVELDLSEEQYTLLCQLCHLVLEGGGEVVSEHLAQGPLVEWEDTPPEEEFPDSEDPQNEPS
jgi:hypothetical protein